MPPAFLRQQLDAVLGDMGADVVKTGMLASADTIHAVADALFGDERRPASGGGGGGGSDDGDGDGGDGGGDKERVHPHPLALVVDPVMVATTGAELLPRAAVRALRERLLPRAQVVTPNVPEARRLLADAEGDEGEDDDDVTVRVESAADLEAVAVRLLTLGPEWVLVKGGHVPLRRRDGRLARTAAEREIVVDVLVGQGGERVRIETSWAESRNTHGTGCSLACGFLSLSIPFPLSLLFPRIDDGDGAV